MAKSEATLKLENDIKAATLKMGVFGCLEVTIGFGGKERVDYMTYDTQNVFRCYEIKVTKSDFHSKHSNSFVGNYNYYVLTPELYEQVKDEIPDYVGCYVGQTCVKKAKRQNIEDRKTIVKSELVPHTEVLKDSIIRSLYRDSQKLHRTKNKAYIDRMRCQLLQQEKEVSYHRSMYRTLYNNVRQLIGRAALRLMTDEDLSEAEVRETFTHHQTILTMNKHTLAQYLHSYQGKNLSVRAIESMLGVVESELKGENNVQQCGNPSCDGTLGSL